MPERRRPQQTPGPAGGEGLPDDDVTLPAALFSDAVSFLAQARQAGRGREVAVEDRFLRAALYAGFASLEATLNQAAFGHAAAHAPALGQIERDVLEERETALDYRGHIVRRTRFYPLEARVSFLALFLSGQEFERGTALWNRFIQAKNLRDTWAHPKPPFNTWSLTIDEVEQAVETVRDVIMELSRLMGLDPPLWLTSAAQALNDLPVQQDEAGAPTDPG